MVLFVLLLCLSGMVTVVACRVMRGHSGVHWLRERRASKQRSWLRGICGLCVLLLQQVPDASPVAAARWVFEALEPVAAVKRAQL